MKVIPNIVITIMFRLNKTIDMTVSVKFLLVTYQGDKISNMNKSKLGKKTLFL